MRIQLPDREKACALPAGGALACRLLAVALSATSWIWSHGGGALSTAGAAALTSPPPAQTDGTLVIPTRDSSGKAT